MCAARQKFPVCNQHPGQEKNHDQHPRNLLGVPYQFLSTCKETHYANSQDPASALCLIGNTWNALFCVCLFWLNIH